MTETANIYTLPSGLRLIHVPSHSPVAYCGISIDAGTRDELPTEQGMAHFCEHMMFKGTTHRHAWHIINRMERVGGDLNAYTNKEETVVYSAFMKEHLPRAAELLFDVVFHSTFPQTEIDKEREVIVDEIESYNDSPADLIFDHFENIIYQGRDLGHDILGTADDVRRFTSADAQAFTRRLYKPERMIFFVMGDYDFEYVKRILSSGYSPVMGRGEEVTDIKETSRMVSPPHYGGGTGGEGPLFIEDRATHQAHVMIGCAAYGAKDDRRIALYFLNNLLGGPGMNSRLNIALREQRGLVYTVESSLTNYTDTSTWAIYFGCDAEDVERCRRLVRKELDRLINQPLTQAQFAAAMKQIKGQIGVACDNSENYILDTAKAFLHYNKFEGMNDTFRQLDKLTPQFLQQVATEVFAPENLTTLIFR
ncbi:MAG: insulinase family protein [Bacteroidaceae bacterium]|nr:insulinase family protein [Bacteroidaceae bacterium]